MWNGRHFDIKPGKHAYPLIVAEAIKRQNPVMGTQGHEIYDVRYLVGIEELGDDISPIDQTDSEELMDPAILHPGKKMTKVKGVTGLYGRGSVTTASPNSGGMVESSFENPNS
ncbi:MAG: hypothetical protein LC723_13445 [Actinobacteria bacterium]|nr:hypothetical protein [Actinomycetota bacterium]